MKKYFVFFLFTFTLFFSNADSFYFDYSDISKLGVTVRSDYKIYKNDKYQGLGSSEIKSIYSIQYDKKNYFDVTCDVYRIRKVMRGNSVIGYSIDNIEKYNFSTDVKGGIYNEESIYFPTLQGLPSFSELPQAVGEVITGRAKVVLENHESGKFEVVPVEYESKYAGSRKYLERDVEYFEIGFNFDSYYTPKKYKKLRGAHNLQFYYDKITKKPLFIKELFDDLYITHDGDEFNKKGFNLYFFKIIESLKSEFIVADFKEKLKEYSDDISVEKTDKGVMLTVNNLQFKPDSVDLIDGEREKLRKIYDLLSKVENRTFLIKGHTANVGNKKEQLALSKKRAETIANYLNNFGINYKKLMTIGLGGSEPIASNETEEGRIKNRRVEIVILED